MCHVLLTSFPSLVINLYVPGPVTFVIIKGPSHELSSLWHPLVFVFFLVLGLRLVVIEAGYSCCSGVLILGGILLIEGSVYSDLFCTVEF